MIPPTAATERETRMAELRNKVLPQYEQYLSTKGAAVAEQYALSWMFKGVERWTQSKLPTTMYAPCVREMRRDQVVRVVKGDGSGEAAAAAAETAAEQRQSSGKERWRRWRRQTPWTETYHDTFVQLLGTPSLLIQNVGEGEIVLEYGKRKKEEEG